MIGKFKALAVAILVGACVNQPAIDRGPFLLLEDGTKLPTYSIYGLDMDDATQERILSKYPELARVDGTKKLLFSKTHIVLTKGHGTQVEYTTQTGLNYLWYPGSSKILVGQAYVIAGDQIGRSYPIICYKYPGGKNYEVDWDYSRASCTTSLDLVSESTLLDGDLFNLSSAELPAIMPKDKEFSLQELQALVEQ